MAFRINRKTAGTHSRQLFGMIAHKYREKPYRREAPFVSLGVKRIINFLPRGTYAGASHFANADGTAIARRNANPA